MEKTSIYLDEADLERVRRIADQQGTSRAQLIRAAIGYYERQIVPKRRFSLLGAFEGDGRSMADIADDELFEGLGQ
jgi:hypothetical protein